MISVTIPAIETYVAKFAQTDRLVPGAIAIGLERASIMLQSAMRLQAPRRTGYLANSIGYKIEGNRAFIGPGVGLLNGQPKYAIFVEKGTGIYGEKGQYIVPVNKKVLATKINPGWGQKNSAGYYIIGKKSKGQKPNPFVQRTADLALPIVRQAFSEANKIVVDGIKI